MHGDLGNMKLKSAIISVALVCSLVSLSSVCKAESFGFFFEDHGTSFSMRQSTQMVTEHRLLQEEEPKLHRS